MLKRKITKILEEWKKEENKQCLLIRGARQVGKTFIIEHFCKKNYESYIYINFDLSPTLKDIFNGDLDANTLIMKLKNHESDYIIPAPPAGIGGRGSLIVATAASVVRKLDATDVAFCRALLETLAGSRIPSSIILTYFSV